MRGVIEHHTQRVHAPQCYTWCLAATCNNADFVHGYGRPMRVDVMTFPKPLAAMGPAADTARHAGFDGMLLTEGGRTAFTAATAAALGAPGLDLSTGVAVAFPRSPMITAQNAWELQELTGGRFRLGLGTQVRTHVVRRYGVDFEHPGPRLRDYVRAVKACFAGFRGEPLDHHGDFYELTFLNRQWSPGPLPDGVADPKVDVAAVNPWMLTMAGEVADGVHVHPIGEPGYLARHVLPCLADGAIRAGRSAGEVDVIVPVTTIVGDTDEQTRGVTRARTGLVVVLRIDTELRVHLGRSRLRRDDRTHSSQTEGRVTSPAMAAEITDDHLATFCTEANWDDLADRLIETYGGTANRLVLYSAGTADPETLERYGAVARTISERTAASS